MAREIIRGRFSVTFVSRYAAPFCAFRLILLRAMARAARLANPGMLKSTMFDKIEITLNGEPHALDSSAASVLCLIEELGYVGKRIAVECNGEIVPKSLHTSTQLQSGDRIEIVVAVGGG